MKRILLLTLVPLVFSFLYSYGKDNSERFRVFYKGSIVFDQPLEGIDSVASVSSRILRVYDKQKNLLIGRTFTTIDSIVIGVPPMEANMIDMVIEGNDVVNVANKNITISTFQDNSLALTSCPQCGGKILHFNGNPLSTITGGYCKVDYANSITTIEQLKNAFTLECTVSADLSDNQEKYIIGSSVGGGFALGTTTENEWAWKISTAQGKDTTWTTINSHIPVTAGEAYHLICTYDSSDSTASIYVNGNLCSSEKLPSTIALPTSSSLQCFALGGQASATQSVYYPWKGSLGSLKIYGQIPSQKQVSELASNTLHKHKPAAEFFAIENVQLSSLYNTNRYYYIYGSKYLNTDSIHFQSTENSSISYTLACSTNNDKASIKLPTEFLNGEYVVSVKRGNQPYCLGQVDIYANNDKDFHQNIRQPLTKNNIMLPQGFSSLTAQGFDFDNNGTPYITYETSIGMRITRWDQARINGSMAADMKLPYSGHGDSFCMDCVNNEIYFWTTGSLGSDGTYSGGKANATDTRLICRFKYVPGSTAYAEDAVCYYINDNGARCISVDRENDILAFWVWENSKDVLKIYKLSEATAASYINLPVDREVGHADNVNAHNLNTITPIGSFTFNRHGDAIQGFCVKKDKIFVEQGIKDDIYALMTVYDFKGNILQDRTPVGFSADKQKVQKLNLSSDGTFEPEGIQIHNGTMYMMFIGDYPADTGNKKHSCILKLQ